LSKGNLIQYENYDKILKNIYLAAGVCAALLFCLFASYSLRYVLYMNKINAFKTEFRADIIAMFGGEPILLRKISQNKSWDFQTYSQEAMNLVAQNIDEEKHSIGLYGNNSSVVLKILNQVSQSIPKNLYFEVSNFKIQSNILYITADTDNPENVNKIIEKLSSVSSIANVKKISQDNKAGSDAKLIRFSMTANILIGTDISGAIAPKTSAPGEG